jgi:hypothetical protein
MAPKAGDQCHLCHSMSEVDPVHFIWTSVFWSFSRLELGGFSFTKRLLHVHRTFWDVSVVPSASYIGSATTVDGAPSHMAASCMASCH